MSKWPAWIIAVAVSVVAIRFTFFPPCCTTLPTVTTRVLQRVDSVGPVVDTSIVAVGDTLIVYNDQIRILGQHAAVRKYPVTGVLLRHP